MPFFGVFLALSAIVSLWIFLVRRIRNYAGEYRNSWPQPTGQIDKDLWGIIISLLIALIGTLIAFN
jgi:hypothetical protein